MCNIILSLNLCFWVQPFNPICKHDWLGWGIFMYNETQRQIVLNLMKQRGNIKQFDVKPWTCNYWTLWTQDICFPIGFCVIWNSGLWIYRLIILYKCMYSELYKSQSSVLFLYSLNCTWTSYEINFPTPLSINVQ